MKCILLNGPYKSGKDTAALAIEDYLYRVRPRTFPTHEKFSRPIKYAFAGMMNESVDDNHNVHYYELHKEEIIPELGVSYRKWMEDYAEKYMKPFYGEQVFAQLFLKRIDLLTHCDSVEEQQFIIVSDCGAQVEPNTLLEARVFTDILLIQVNRPGRSYGTGPREKVIIQLPGKTIVLQNDSTLENFQAKAVMAVKEWLHD